MIVKVVGTDLTLKRNQAFVMKYIMQNYKKLAYVLDIYLQKEKIQELSALLLIKRLFTTEIAVNFIKTKYEVCSQVKNYSVSQ
jgi:hypothetical protein